MSFYTSNSNQKICYFKFIFNSMNSLDFKGERCFNIFIDSLFDVAIDSLLNIAIIKDKHLFMLNIL